MSWTRCLNILCVLLVAGLTHALSQRISARVLPRLHGAGPTDRWILYILFSTVILLLGFHTLGAVALATEVNLVHITTLSGLLLALWFADRFLVSPHAVLIGFPLRALLNWRVWEFRLPQGRSVRWSLYLAGVLYLVFFIEAATRPPTGWDGLEYHLPMAAKWLQNGNLNFLEESWKFQMPSNGEIILLLLMYLGEDRILSLAFLPFALFGLILVYSFARRLGSSSSLSALCASGFGTMPIILFHAFSAYTDLFGAVFQICAIYLVFWWIQEKSLIHENGSKHIALAGLAFGVALGSKYAYVPMMVVMTAVIGSSALWVGGKPRVSRQRLQAALRLSLIFCMWCIVSSAFWYVRNLAKTGNPMHPLQLTFDGFVPRVSLQAMKEPQAILTGKPHIWKLEDWIVQPWIEYHPSGGYYSVNSGLGAVFATFLPLTILTASMTVLMALLRRRQLSLVMFPFFMSAALLGYWWLYLWRLLRMILHVLGLFFILLSHSLGLFSGNRQQVASYLFFCAMLINAVLLAVSPLMDLSSRLYHRAWSRNAYYQIPEVIDALPKDSVILNGAHPLKNYALFGHKLQNRVVTSRALIEPLEITNITEAFVSRWQIEYIYYTSNRKMLLENERRYQVVHRRWVEENFERFEEVLYHTDWFPKVGSERSAQAAGRARVDYFRTK